MLNILISILLTILIELFVLLILKARPRVLWLSIIINTVTNVLLNCLIESYFFSSFLVYLSTVLILEMGVFIYEAIMYYFIIGNYKPALKYALATNLTSFLIGLVISVILLII